MRTFGFVGVAVFGVVALLFLRLPPLVAKQDSIFNTYRALVEVNALARQRFVEPIHDDRLVEGAIRGMLLKLDPYSGYIPPYELEAYMRRNQGAYIGIGLEVGVENGRLGVIAPFDDSPAQAAGVLAGDTILAVDGVDTEGMSVLDLSERLSGRPGTPVTLRLLRTGLEDPWEVTIVRSPVSLQTIRGVRRGGKAEWDYLLDDRTAYIRVGHFRENTAAQFDRALGEAIEAGAEGLILDLRFNPGGVLDQAVALVDRFISEGLIVETVTRRRAVCEYFAKREGTLDALPLVVLINAASASSSEVVAGALQDHERAVIVGTRSFGKASVQHLIPLTSEAAAVKLTVAYYRLPSGRIIHRPPQSRAAEAWGVLPDIEVTLTNDEVADIQAARRALDQGTGAAANNAPLRSNMADAVPKAPPQPEILRDRQLLAAIHALHEKP